MTKCAHFAITSSDDSDMADTFAVDDQPSFSGCGDQLPSFVTQDNSDNSAMNFLDEAPHVDEDIVSDVSEIVELESLRSNEIEYSCPEVFILESSMSNEIELSCPEVFILGNSIINDIECSFSEINKDIVSDVSEIVELESLRSNEIEYSCPEVFILESSMSNEIELSCPEVFILGNSIINDIECSFSEINKDIVSDVSEIVELESLRSNEIEYSCPEVFILESSMSTEIEASCSEVNGDVLLSVAPYFNVNPRYDNVVKLDFVQELCVVVLKHLSNKKHDSNYLFSTLYSHLGDHLLNEKFRSFIQRLGCRKNRFDQRLFDWLTPSTKTKRGRPSHSNDTQQVCFDMWVENSIISVDRRDGRDVIKIPRTAF